MIDLEYCSFLPCQTEYILDESPILMVEKSRQIGITWTSGFKIPYLVFTSDIPQDHFWISKDEFTAKLFLQDVLFWIQFINIMFNYKREFKQDVIDINGVQATRIKFNCGSNLFILSSSIDAVVGKRGNFYIDEGAVHKDLEQLYNIALPCTTWGFKLTIFSTHRSKQNYFYKLCDRVRNGDIIGGKLMTFTLQRVLDEGYIDRINAKKLLVGAATYETPEEFFNEKKNNASSEEIFNQEYMCIPADADATQAVKESDLARVMFPQNDLFLQPQSGKKYFAGIDIGRNRDLTVIWICEDVSTGAQPMLVTRYLEKMYQTEFNVQERKIADVLQRWKPRHCMIDGTNVGAMIAENLEKRFSFCEAVKITAVTRPRFISDLVGFIRRDPVALKIPNSNEIWEDFLSVERYINKHGKEDFFIPSHKTKGHGDRFMAMVLCLQSFMSKRSLARYTMQNEGGAKSEPVKKTIQRKSSIKQRFKY